jgi:hypothetical protein
MKRCTFGALGFVLGVAMAFVASVPQARAATYQIDLSISYDKAVPNAAAGLLNGQAQFFEGNSSLSGGLTDIAGISLGQKFSWSFTPSDPCFGQNSCSTIGFRFAGFTQGFGTDAFGANDIIPGTQPAFPPLIALANLIPVDPCFGGGTVCHVTGPIYAFDAPVNVGTWDVTVTATPLPGAFAMFSGGHLRRAH